MLFSDKMTDKLKVKHFKPLIITINKNLRRIKSDIKRIKREFSCMAHDWIFGKLGNGRPQMALSSMTSSVSFKIDWCLEFHKTQGLKTSLFSHTTKIVLTDACYIKDSEQVSPLRFPSFLWCSPLVYLHPNYWAGSNEPCPRLRMSNGVTKRSWHGTTHTGISFLNRILIRKRLSNKVVLKYSHFQNIEGDTITRIE